MKRGQRSQCQMKPYSVTSSTTVRFQKPYICLLFTGGSHGQVGVGHVSLLDEDQVAVSYIVTDFLTLLHTCTHAHTLTHSCTPTPPTHTHPHTHTHAHTHTHTHTVYGATKSDSSSVATRQQAVNSSYDKLVQGAGSRRGILEDTVRLFGLFRECDEVERWIREKVGVAYLHIYNLAMM